MPDFLKLAARGVSEIFNRVPFEKLLIKPRDTSKDRAELVDILKGTGQAAPTAAPQEESQPSPGMLQPRIAHPQRVKEIAERPAAESGVSNHDTLEYQKREIGKLLLRMERHYAQKMRINNIPCDCGAGKHLLDIESLTEETIPMVDDVGIYERILEWVKKSGPMSTTEAAKSGRFDNAYTHLSHEARDMRKNLMGTLDPHALWPTSETTIADILKKYDQEDAQKALVSAGSSATSSE